jgi:hypothetical protein
LASFDLAYQPLKQAKAKDRGDDPRRSHKLVYASQGRQNEVEVVLRRGFE